MVKNVDFEEIRPYFDEEVNPALKRVTASPGFGKILDFIFPGKDHKKIIEDLNNTYSAIDFQKKFMHPLVYSIVNKTSDGLSCSGFEHITPGTPYLFVSNHRDIVLDSAILQALLVDKGHLTSEITFGSNLMTDPFVIDLGKVNRMYKVYRGNNKSELLRNSRVLSAYIRHSINEKKVSSWIAQRNGRTKDGNDRTETGLLKMFNMSGRGDFYESFKELNIIPMSVSYEYEPCCSFKVREIYISSIRPYEKKPGEDLHSIITGITQPKGRIHIALCKPVNSYIDTVNESADNARIGKLAKLIDKDIYLNYRLWPGNYIAYDLLQGGTKYTGNYTAAEKVSFLDYMQKELSGIEGDQKIITEIFLRIYTNPVINQENSR